MSSHHAIPACIVPNAPNTTGTTCVRHCHMRLTSTPQVTVFRQLLSLFPGNVAISRTADINKETSVCLLISETDVRTIGTDLPSNRNGSILHHSDVVRLHKPIMMMPVPSALHWNPKMTTNVPMDNRGHLIVSISVVHRCVGTTACNNVVNYFQAYTAQAVNGTDISMQNVTHIIPSPKSLVLSSNNQPSVAAERFDDFSQPSVGLFHVHRWFLSETMILTMHTFPTQDCTQREPLHMRKCLHWAEALGQRHHHTGCPTSMQAL